MSKRRNIQGLLPIVSNLQEPVMARPDGKKWSPVSATVESDSFRGVAADLHGAPTWVRLRCCRDLWQG